MSPFDNIQLHNLEILLFLCHPYRITPTIQEG